MDELNSSLQAPKTPPTSFCVLCCYSYVAPRNKEKPGPKSKCRNGVRPSFGKFCEKIAAIKGIQAESLIRILEPTSSSSSSTCHRISVCPECLGLIDKTMECKGRVDSIEGHVRSLQLQILEQLRQLEEMVTSYHEEMKKIESVVDSADVSCLEFQVHQLRIQNGENGTSEDYSGVSEEDMEEIGRQVFLFREGVLEAAADQRGDRNVHSAPTENADYFSEPIPEFFPNVEVDVDESEEGLNVVKDYYYDDTYTVPQAEESVPIIVPSPSQDPGSRPKRIICKKTTGTRNLRDPLAAPEQPSPSGTRRIIIIKKVNPVEKNVPKATRGNKKLNFGELIPAENGTGTENVFCKICYKTFDSAESLMAHAYTHGGDFKCNICRKGFSSWEEMEEHETTHRKYECSFCEKSFKNAGNLRAHERIHTGERPYKCRDCPKDFIQLGGLQYHLRTNPSHRALQ